MECHKATGYTDVYRRMWWDRPASRLTTRCISYSYGRFGHPEQDRAISLREAACLQTFPVDYRFAGNLNAKARQIGNAVPVRLATVVGRHVIRHLTAEGVNLTPTEVTTPCRKRVDGAASLGYGLDEFRRSPGSS